MVWFDPGRSVFAKSRVRRIGRGGLARGKVSFGAGESFLRSSFIIQSGDAAGQDQPCCNAEESAGL